MILRSGHVCPSAGAPDDDKAENWSLKCSFGGGPLCNVSKFSVERLINASTHWSDHLVDSSCKISC